MVNPFSAGTLTLQEAPSFAWRTNGLTFSRRPREQNVANWNWHRARLVGCSVLLCAMGKRTSRLAQIDDRSTRTFRTFFKDGLKSRVPNVLAKPTGPSVHRFQYCTARLLKTSKYRLAADD